MKDAKGHGSEAHQTGVNQIGSGPHQIVYARAEKTALVPTGRTVVRDMNQFPEFKAGWEGRAGMWLNKGTDADVEKAQKALSAEGYTIHTYPQTERDPLGKARATVVQRAKQTDMPTAYAEGYKARYMRLWLSDNPYIRNSEPWVKWRDGWSECDYNEFSTSVREHE